MGKTLFRHIAKFKKGSPCSKLHFWGFLFSSRLETKFIIITVFESGNPHIILTSAVLLDIVIVLFCVLKTKD